MATMWSIADIVRNVYYINKSDTAAFLRYNLFIVLYPIGVYGEMRVINDYIKRHASILEIS
jgi:very-long-chain (3R)-3-hydroxyacyl-CoA dehydratase